MKPFVFLLTLFFNLCVFDAKADLTFLISVSPTTVSGEYACYLKDPNGGKWEKGDLITWILPDGQYLQSEEPAQSSTNISSSVMWKPIVKPLTSDIIIAYVARKGKPGNPTRVTAPAGSLITDVTASTPAPVTFPPGKKWKFSQTWSFSPENNNISVLSYDPSGCSTSPGAVGGVNITFESSKMVFQTDKIFFNNELGAFNSTAEYRLQLKNKAYNRHVFIETKLKPGVKVGDTIKIEVKGNVCNDIVQTDTFLYIVAADPHDPNWKIVDIDTINANGPAVRLTYTIQYHNDGQAAVNMIDIDDKLPAQIDPTTFQITSMPLEPPQDAVVLFPEQDHLRIEFTHMNLPGLNESPAYGYDETIYRFSFQADTKPNLTTTFPNSAVITFHDSAGDPMSPIITDPALVYTQSPQKECPRRCCWPFCWLRKWCHKRK